MCDCDRPDLYSLKAVRVRKSHECIECCTVIQSGEQAEKVDALYDGAFKTFYTCLECGELIAHIRANIPDIEVDCHGELSEILWEAGCCYSDDDIEEEYSVLPFYDESKGVVRGSSCHIATKADWLIIVGGKFRLNPSLKEAQKELVGAK